LRYGSVGCGEHTGDDFRTHTRHRANAAPEQKANPCRSHGHNRAVFGKRGLRLLENGGGNYLVRAHPGLTIKDGCWRWSERGLSGNAIDLCMQVLQMRFNDAMRTLSQAGDDIEGGAGPDAS
jgi:hypothetical protein